MHKLYMIRNYSYAFFPITIRIIHPLMNIVISDMLTSHIICVFLTTVVNITVSEIIVKKVRDGYIFK